MNASSGSGGTKKRKPDDKTPEEGKESELYQKLRKIYFDNELGEGNRRLYAYNLLICEWQSELSETLERSEPTADRINTDGSWKETGEKKQFKIKRTK